MSVVLTDDAATNPGLIASSEEEAASPSAQRYQIKVWILIENIEHVPAGFT